MASALAVLKQKILTLIEDAKKIKSLAYDLKHISSIEAKNVRQPLQTKYQKWYRTARQLMMLHDFSGYPDFEKEYIHINAYIRNCNRFSYHDYEENFLTLFQVQVALLAALPDEIEAQHYSLLKALSTDMALNELEQAEILLANDFEHPAGVLARVALEQYIKALYRTTISSQPIPKFEQCTIELKKVGVFEERHRKHLTALYNIGSDCAHGKSVPKDEIAKFIVEVKTIVLHGK